jgi:hypothetical protein
MGITVINKGDSMGTTQAFAKETERLTGLATAIDRAPESRINAARALLRHTRFADRSLRIAKKLARDFMDNDEVSALVRAKARNLFTYLTEKIVDENEAPAVFGATGEPTAETVDPSLPADFNKPYFSKLAWDFDDDADALAALAAAAYEKFGTQATHRKNEQGVWERTPAYQRARQEHSAAIRALGKKEAAHGNATAN